MNELRAWAVHAYTALGLAAGFFALAAAAEGRARDMFLLLIVAAAIDGTDGTLARRFEVLRWTPQFDGRKLDDITDYLNYVFVPIFFAYRAGLVSAAWAPVCALALLASGFRFCHATAKTREGFFTGFPSYWNVIVFYLYMMRAAPTTAGLVLLAFSLLVFVPTEYVSPLRPPVLVWLNTLLLALWAIALVFIFREFASPDPVLVLLSLGFPIFHLAMSHVLHVQRMLARD